MLDDVIQERFWAKVAKAGEDECWEWTAARTAEGYGHMWVHGAIHKAHRIAYAINAGIDLEPGQQGGQRSLVCHSCDNPPCVNPRHLFSGSDADNARDRSAKGRSESPRAGGRRLTAEQVLAIKALPDLSQKEVARRFGISSHQVRNIRRGVHWRKLANADQ